jgi:primase-polymerase (primpol)-like protein
MNTKPEPVYPIVENIPEELTRLDQWVNWFWKLDGDKYTKPLIDPKTLKGGSHSDPSTWGTFEQALNKLNNHKWLAGIGFAFSENDPYAGIDLDDCRNTETGEITPFALSIIHKLNSYTEISPSQRGVKIIVKGRLPEYVSEGGGKNEELRIEVYDRKRYFTITGQVLDV